MITPTEEEKKIIEEFSKLWDEGFVSYTYPQHKKDLEAFILDVVRRVREEMINILETEMPSLYKGKKLTNGQVIYNSGVLNTYKSYLSALTSLKGDK